MGDVVREVAELARGNGGVSEITLLGQNVNSYGRDLGSGQWSRSSPTCCGPSTRSTASSGSGTPRRTRRTCVPRRRSRWPSVRASASTSTSRCSRAVTPCSHGCDGATRPRATSRSSRWRAATIDDLAVTTDIIVGFPGETEADFAGTLALVDAARYDAAYTFVFSPRPGDRRGRDGGRLRARGGRPGAHAPAHGPGRAPRAGQARGARGTDGGGRGRGSLQEGPHASPPAAPARTSSSTSPASFAARQHGTRRDHEGGAALVGGDAGRGGRRSARRAPASR